MVYAAYNVLAHVEIAALVCDRSSHTLKRMRKNECRLTGCHANASSAAVEQTSARGACVPI